MKNIIIKTVMIINIISIFAGFCLMEQYNNIFSILFTIVSICIFGVLYETNKKYFQKKVDKILEWLYN